jgi:hypothetical protein
MFEERSSHSESQDPTLRSESPQGEGMHDPSSMTLKVAIVIFVLIAGFVAGYAWLQHNAVQQLSAERADLRTSLNQAKTQVDDLTIRVNALAAAKEREEAIRAQNEADKTEAAKEEVARNEQVPAHTRETPRHRTHHVVNRSAHVDDPRWQKVQQQLGDQQKQLADSQKQIADTQANLEQTKSELSGNLQSARSELGSGIAHNHEQLVALEKKGERNYYEFSYDKSSILHRTGPISIALRKADSKHAYCDLQMLVDDRTITRKHINLFESVTLHPEGYPQPLELVINRIDKNAVKGYLSEPKYKTPLQNATPTATAAPTAAPTTSAAVTTPSTPESSLEHRPTAQQ